MELQLDMALVSIFNKLFDPIPVSFILVDKEGRVLLLNTEFAAFLGVDRDASIGKMVTEIDPNSRFPYVLKNKKAELSMKHRFANGHNAIVHRIPVLDDKGDVQFGFGMVLFDDVSHFREIVHKNKLLEDEISFYKEQLRQVQGAIYNWDNIIGESERITQTKYFAKKAAQTDSTVLLIGESGTGKELFGHAIHNASRRSFQPFVKVNCAAIPNELIESELFGYEEGAFTGAKKGGKIGKFELANGGTILLDEIGDMPLGMQVKLLRTLQEKEIERVGGTRTQKIDVRVIASTNKDLKKMVQQGKFREDLYYRLNVMLIEIPSLKERLYDLEPLCDHLIGKIAFRLGRHVTGLSEPALRCLKNHDWPGNVRELENVLERAVNLVEAETIQLEHLPLYVFEKGDAQASEDIRELSVLVEEVERRAIAQCLRLTKGNKIQTAKLLNISRSNLYEKLAKYQLTE